MNLMFGEHNEMGKSTSENDGFKKYKKILNFNTEKKYFDLKFPKTFIF